MDVTTQILIIIDCLKPQSSKPIAVVRLVIKVAMPTLVVTRCKALALLWWILYSDGIYWSKNIWNSITMIKEGTKAVKTVIS
jgi:hypothetical protein